MTGTPIDSRGWIRVLLLVACLSLLAAPVAVAGPSRAPVGDGLGPDISVTNASVTRATIAPGDVAVVRVTVTNTGDESGSRALQLTGNGRAYVQTLVHLDGGETRTVTFDQVFETPGRYELAVDGVTAGTLTVRDGSTAGSTTEAGATPARRKGGTLTAWVLIAVLGAGVAAGSVYFVRQR